MTFHEFLAFLLPEFDIIQLMFGGVMLFLVLLTIVKLSRQANVKFWENKWQGNVSSESTDALDVEHGSVNEISEVVASPAEKMADIMPGILLILGLLGTFLGLGIALNKASDILIDANSAGMDSAMSNLMGMMEGLGTKFKTSTWGISAFLILKTWVAAKGYDEKRLRWCTQKMKAAFELSRQNKRIEHEQAQQRLLDALQGGLDCAQREGEATRQSLQTLHAGLEPLLKILVDQGYEASLQDKNRENHMAKLSDMLQTTQQQLIASDQAQSEQNRQQLAELTTTRESLQRFIDANSDNLVAIQQSAGKMAHAAQEMGDSAGDLQGAIGDFRTGITDMLGTVKNDLGSTINQMGESFSQNMGSISTSMANATDGISHAVSDLSQNVGTTMSEVRVSIDQSMKTQRDAQREFMITSETLNEKVIAMTKLVDDMREQIVNGLTAVSSSNRQVASLNNRYAGMTESGEKSAQALEELVNELQAMQQHSPLQPGMDAINAGISQLVRSIELLRDETLSSADASTALSSLDDRLIDALKELSVIRETLSSPERERLAQQFELTLKPIAATLKSLDKTLMTLNTADNAA
ncbi:hypothetical protein [Pectobacterium aquaticum]|uniref:MotA/TolQ/ExbB proton channel domain-containing protein n=1 Tax=Pectobacterium aquaticum TaxID=2204145 RepID=A0AA93AKA5_9GAMM|nr:hypothetical protein [Pectobacterium aquaticum]RRN94510.1 hypothetical protein DMB79_015720 [Pectobacterium aquaticum]RRO03035.1 hypothetical protein DMB83_006995 [Pectobacterium aquaticum]RRO08566.1 hypothetical protein DMB81_007235 [Pectobacterium aquaticum]RRO11476.1 hypothetical protein DMB85_003040 [Pectobacterium aquaticum]RRO17384.1 hypothetical protein DMB84_014570 [Pectobacterium aquaticum]